MEIGEITYYRRYVDDNIIIFDQKKINEDVFTNYMNNLHKYLECKLRGDENNNINYSDLSTHTQKNHNVHVGIYRKPTQTDTTIHFTSYHPLEHKLTAYHLYIRRMLTIQSQSKQDNKNRTLSTPYLEVMYVHYRPSVI